MDRYLQRLFRGMREPTWWGWIVSGSLLVAGIFGSRAAFGGAILFSIAQFAYFAASDNLRLSIPAQVRLIFATYLAAADATGMLWLCWVPVAGTLVRLVFCYCLLGRTLVLLPWNRDEPFSFGYLRQAFTVSLQPTHMRQGAPLRAYRNSPCMN